jgi:phosphoribosyl 1,2-cyclic phosphodiesterase
MSAGGMAVRFWGVRGTIACPGAATLRYGGNTACVEILCDGARLILDAGTGLRALGEAMLAEATSTQRATHVLLSHTHLDHVLGLPFFRPAYRSDNSFTFWNGHLRAQGRHLKDVLGTLMQKPYFPVPLDIMHAKLGFHDFDAGSPIDLGCGLVIATAPLRHPGGATGYRIAHGGRTVCYVTDTEHQPGSADANILKLIADADLVIYDSTYDDREFAGLRGWGHSTWQEGVRLCKSAGAKRLAAFHHDPDQDDTALDRRAIELDRALPGSIVAREGLVLNP